jgi:membrane-bound lytic murein transglycosylase
MFKKLTLSAVLVAFSFAAGSAMAQDAAKKEPTAQQTKMATCNKDAGDKKGDERKAFMKECLSAKKAEATDKKTAQQEKMKSCNKEATGKKGDERKAFMKECLKG